MGYGADWMFDQALKQEIEQLGETPGPCKRKCTICEGQPHHWIPGFEEDEDGEVINPDIPMLFCKHCPAAIRMPDDWDEF